VEALELLYDFAAERSSYLLIRKAKLAEGVNELTKSRAQDFSATICRMRSALTPAALPMS
jgi:hypothetical protein